MIFARGAARRNGRKCGRSAWPTWSAPCNTIRALADAHLLVARLQTLPGGDRKLAMTAINELVKLSGDEPEKQVRGPGACAAACRNRRRMDSPTSTTPSSCAEERQDAADGAGR